MKAVLVRRHLVLVAVLIVPFARNAYAQEQCEQCGTGQLCLVEPDYLWGCYFDQEDSWICLLDTGTYPPTDCLVLGQSLLPQKK